MDNFSNKFNDLSKQLSNANFRPTDVSSMFTPKQLRDDPQLAELVNVVNKMQQDNIQRDIDNKKASEQDRRFNCISLVFSGIAIIIAFVSLMLAVGTILRWW